MILVVRVGSTDVARSRAFYDAALAPLGFAGTPVSETMTIYAHPGGGARLVVARPRDGEATPANGGTIGFAAPSAAAIDAFHAAGLAAGGADEGAPGPRAAIGGAYAAYLRDPDGNKLAAIVQAGA